MPDVSSIGERIVTTVRAFVTQSLAPLESRLAELEQREVPLPQRGEPGPPGERGTDGAPGSTGAAGRDGVDGVDGKDGAAGINGKDGRDGVDGKDGTSVTLEQITAAVKGVIEVKFAEYVLEHERRLPDLLQRMVDQIEKPKDGRDGRDGKDGEDGADGFDLRHFDVTQVDERSFVLRFKDLRREIARQITLPVPIVRNVWKAGDVYRAGDIVTWGGSAFVKQTDEDGGKPEESPHWRLFVKRGRDGKDGEKGDKGDAGKSGRNGRDLTQLGHDGAKW